MSIDPDPRKLLWQCHQIKVGRGLDRAVLNFRKRLRFRSTPNLYVLNDGENSNTKALEPLDHTGM